MVRSPKTLAKFWFLCSLSLPTSIVDAEAQPSLPPSPPPPDRPPPLPGEPPAPRFEVAGTFEPVRFELDPRLRVMSLRGAVPVVGVVGFRRRWWYEAGFAPAYSPVCSGPCVTRLTRGEYRLALARYGGPPVPAPELVTIDRPVTVHGYYTDRSGVRAVGWTVAVAGAVAGVVTIAASTGSEEVCDTDGFCFSRATVNGPVLAGGIGVLVVSALVGAVLAFRHDEAHFTVEPLTLSRTEPPNVPTARASPEGLGISVRF
jgi:hypothetical protein